MIRFMRRVLFFFFFFKGETGQSQGRKNVETLKLFTLNVAIF